MNINYILSAVFIIISYHLVKLGLEMAKKETSSRIIMSPTLIDWMFRFKVSMSIAYFTASVWQLLVAVNGTPAVSDAYLYIVFVINCFILFNVVKIREHFKTEI
jgi:hypothetical protein